MKRVDLEVAVVAGLCVAFPLHHIFTLPGTCDSPNPLTLGKAAALLAVVASYLSVPLLSGLLGRRRVGRFAWLLTPVLGSLLSAATLDCLLPRPFDWGLELRAKVWLALCVWTLPFAAAAYYWRRIIRGLRGRRDETKENLSISPR